MVEGIKSEWDFSGLCDESEMEAKRKEWRRVTDAFISKWLKREDYLKEPGVLKEALDEYEEWNRLFGDGADEFFYYWLKNRQDQNDPKIKAKYNKIEGFVKEIVNDISFFSLNVAKISQKERFLESSELSEYKHYLERIFDNEKYNLSLEEEKIINLKSSSSHSLWVKMVSEFLSKEEREVLNEDGTKEAKGFSDLFGLLISKNKKVRDSAAQALNDILTKHVDVAEAEMNAILNNKKVNDEIRGLDRPDKGRHVSDDIDSEVVDSLLESVSSNFELSKRYYELKAKLLEVDKLEYHERIVEYGSIDKKYNFEESVELVRKVFSKLDEKFSEILDRFLANGQIDVYPKKGKQQGAFCVHMLKSQPTYVLLNHNDKLGDVETLAHEMGHAINAELMKEKQNALNFGTVLSTAEVASTFFEDFVLQELMKEADEEMKLSLMMQKLDGDISTIIRQISCYLFEQELHKQYREKSYLSKEEIGGMFSKHMSNYMGEYVRQSDGSENWWVYWSHIRRFFYVYSYASGLLISKALQRKVKEDLSYINKVKEFLSTGLSKAPKDIFLSMGLDITKKEFWDSGLAEIEELLSQTEALAKKLGKI